MIKRLQHLFENFRFIAVNKIWFLFLCIPANRLLPGFPVKPNTAIQHLTLAQRSYYLFNQIKVLQKERYNEPQLIQELSCDSDIAFETIYRQYSPALYLKLLRLLKSKSLAEDVLQDVFIIVWNNRKKIDPGKSFRSYLYCIAVHKCYDYFRKLCREKKMFLKLTAESNHHDENKQNFIAREEATILLQAIDLLPPKRRLIFRLCKVDGKSYEEVSRELGVSLSTISDHIVKANIFIRTKLSHSIG